MGRISSNQESHQNKRPDADDINYVQVQCFPLFAILSALNRTRIDYFSLDIEGDELQVLKTVPWNRVDIKVRMKSKFRYNHCLKIALLLLFRHCLWNSSMGEKARSN
jgi:hypothetical protein